MTDESASPGGPVASATSTSALPAGVGRAAFQAELDRLRVPVLGVMSAGWMALIAVLVTAQKLLPPRAALDVPLALAIVAFGIVIIVGPSLVPGLTPPM